MGNVFPAAQLALPSPGRGFLGGTSVYTELLFYRLFPRLNLQAAHFIFFILPEPPALYF